MRAPSTPTQTETMMTAELGTETQVAFDRLRAFPPTSFDRYSSHVAQPLPGLSSMLHPRHASASSGAAAAAATAGSLANSLTQSTPASSTPPRASMHGMAPLPSSSMLPAPTASHMEATRSRHEAARAMNGSSAQGLAKKRRREEREAVRNYGTSIMTSGLRNGSPMNQNDTMANMVHGPMKAAKRTDARMDGHIVPPAPIKSSRYLREIDRRVILSRIERGEKQAALAKEYQVSRAAICNLKKHREEVLSRKDENPLAKHPKKPRPKSTKSKKAKNASSSSREDEDSCVHEMKTRSTAVLLTALRDRRTGSSDFHRCTERILRMLIEEALALVPVKKVEVFMNDTEKVSGVGMKHPPCAISMVDANCPLLQTFHLVEPDQPAGCVRANENAEIELDDHHLPSSFNNRSVLLFDLALSSVKSVDTVIQLLLNRGAVEERISIVAMFICPEVIPTIRAKYPAVQLVAAQIDPNMQGSSTTVCSDTDSSTGSTPHVMGVITRMSSIYQFTLNRSEPDSSDEKESKDQE